MRVCHYFKINMAQQIRDDLYKQLQIPDFSPMEDIKKAYRTLALRWHPDRVPEAEKPKATANMQGLNAIYEFLSKNKNDYDNALRASRQPRPQVVVTVVSFGFGGSTTTMAGGTWYYGTP